MYGQENQITGLTPATQTKVPELSTYELARSVAAAIADRMQIKVELTGIPELADTITAAVTVNVMRVIREDRERAEEDARMEAKRKAAAKRKRARKK